METLSDRVSRLEGQNRRWRAAVSALRVVFAALVAIGQADPERAPDEIKARSFAVVDEEGEVWVSLTSSGLLLYNPRGEIHTPMAELKLDHGGAQLVLSPHYWGGADGVRLASSFAGPNTLTLGDGLRMESSNETARMRLGHSGRNGIELSVADEEIR